MQLTVVRHANAVSPQAGLKDFHRPLTDEGRQEAKAAATRFIAEAASKPDLLLSSPAVRALETAKIFAAELGYDPARIQTDSRLYPGSMDAIGGVVGEIGPDIRYAVVFGHNPGISEFARRLSGNTIRGMLPTAGFVTVTFPPGS